MEPQQTHTERDELNILSTWMQGYRMVDEAVQYAAIFQLSLDLISESKIDRE